MSELTVHDLLVRYGLDMRAANCLKNQGINLASEVAALSEADMLKWPNMGRKSIVSVRKALSDSGVREDIGYWYLSQLGDA